jgi:ABC-type glycerol-3-phosphate transport system substrate-binding protein
VWLDWSPDELAALQPVIETFQQQHAGVEISLTYVPTASLRAGFEAAAGSDGGPTVLFGPDVWGPPLYDAGLIEDLTEVMAPGLQQGLHPIALGQAAYDTAFLGVPLELQGIVLYINLSWMAEPPENVADLAPAAGAVEAGPALPAAPDLGASTSVSHLAACGGAMMGADGEPTFSGEVGECWLELMRIVASAGPVTYNTDDDLIQFEAGEIAWMMGGTWNLQRVEAAIGEGNLAIAPWPLYEVTGRRMAGYVWTENAYLASGLSAADFEAVWEFVRLLASPEVQTSFSEAEGAHRLPAANGIWITDPLMSQAMNSILQGVPYPLDPAASLYATALERAIFAILRQGAESAAAIERAQDEIIRALATPGAGQ